MFLFSSLSTPAQEKITYQDHVLPLIENNCGKCHNPDKKKGDLDLTSYSGALKGGGSGPVVVAGNPDSSKLWKAITHAEDPTMPPNKPKLPDKERSKLKGFLNDAQNPEPALNDLFWSLLNSKEFIFNH